MKLPPVSSLSIAGIGYYTPFPNVRIQYIPLCGYNFWGEIRAFWVRWTLDSTYPINWSSPWIHYSGNISNGEATD